MLRGVPIAPLTAEAIRRLRPGGSLSDLFEDAPTPGAPIAHPHE